MSILNIYTPSLALFQMQIPNSVDWFELEFYLKCQFNQHLKYVQPEIMKHFGEELKRLHQPSPVADKIKPRIAVSWMRPDKDKLLCNTCNRVSCQSQARFISGWQIRDKLSTYQCKKNQSSLHSAQDLDHNDICNVILLFDLFGETWWVNFSCKIQDPSNKLFPFLFVSFQLRQRQWDFLHRWMGTSVLSQSNADRTWLCCAWTEMRFQTRFLCSNKLWVKSQSWSVATTYRVPFGPFSTNSRTTHASSWEPP